MPPKVRPFMRCWNNKLTDPIETSYENIELYYFINLREKHHLGALPLKQRDYPLLVNLDNLAILNLECADILWSIAFDFIDTLISNKVSVLCEVNCSVYTFEMLNCCKTVSDSLSVCSNFIDDGKKDVCSIIAVCCEGVWTDAPL